jgi:hypothetical protein
MGEVADDILAGIMCQQCGQWMPEIHKYWDDKDKLTDFFDNPPGYPRTCPDCVQMNKEEIANQFNWKWKRRVYKKSKKKGKR